MSQQGFRLYSETFLSFISFLFNETNINNWIVLIWQHFVDPNKGPNFYRMTERFNKVPFTFLVSIHYQLQTCQLWFLIFLAIDVLIWVWWWMLHFI
jgi:hypothetical protein